MATRKPTSPEDVIRVVPEHGDNPALEFGAFATYEDRSISMIEGIPAEYVRMSIVKGKIVFMINELWLE